MAQPIRRVAVIAFTGIALAGILGAFHRLGWGFALFDFDGEAKPPAMWSALVLASGGVTSLLVGRLDGERPYRAWWFALGGFLLFMAVDEAVTLHEHAMAFFHEDWQHLWAPIVLVGGLAWLKVVRRIWGQHRERMLMIAGAGAWFVAQIDEHFQSNPEDGRVAGYGSLSGIEEVLETTGSALFLLALLGTLHLRARSARNDA